MQHPMMRAAEAELLQHMVRVGDEVPVGEEQQLDEVPDRLACGAARSPACGEPDTPASREKIYVSHIDIFRFDCYSRARFDERIVPEARFRRRRCGRSVTTTADAGDETYRDLRPRRKTAPAANVGAGRAPKETTPWLQSFDKSTASSGTTASWCLERAKLHVLSHGLHYASCRVRGRARLWRRDLQEHRAFRAAEALGQDARLRDSLFGRRDRRRQAAGAREERPDGRLCAAGRLARLAR